MEIGSGSEFRLRNQYRRRTRSDPHKSLWATSITIAEAKHTFRLTPLCVLLFRVEELGERLILRVVNVVILAVKLPKNDQKQYKKQHKNGARN